MRDQIIQILKSRPLCYSDDEDLAPSVRNAPEVADLILEVFRANPPPAAETDADAQRDDGLLSGGAG